MLPLFQAVVVLSLIAVPLTAKMVPCSRGLVEEECPAQYPICCMWPNGVFAACCPSNGRCQLDDGTCTVIRNSSGSLPPNEAQGGVSIGVGEAAGLMSGGLLAMFMLVCLCGVLGRRCHARWLENRRRREEERRAMLEREESDEDGVPMGTDDDVDLEDPQCCKLCYATRANCILLECGHVCCCRSCAKRLKICPICRENVKKILPLQTSKMLSPKPTGVGQSEQETKTKCDEAMVVRVQEETRSEGSDGRELSTPVQNVAIAESVNEDFSREEVASANGEEAHSEKGQEEKE